MENAIKAKIREQVIELKACPSKADKQALADRLGVSLPYVYQVLRMDFGDAWRALRSKRGRPNGFDARRW